MEYGSTNLLILLFAGIYLAMVYALLMLAARPIKKSPTSSDKVENIGS